MTWEEWDRAKELLENLENGDLSKKQILEALLLLLRDFYERGQE